MKKLLAFVVIAALGTGAVWAQRAEGSIRSLLQAYRSAAMANSREGQANWVAHHVYSNFMGVSTPDMSTYDKSSWYNDILDNTNRYRCKFLKFEINSFQEKDGVVVMRMNVDFRGSRTMDGRRQNYRSYASYRDTWKHVGGRWVLDTDEERGYKQWVNGRLTVSRLEP